MVVDAGAVALEVGSHGACEWSPWLGCWLTTMVVRAAWWLAIGGRWWWCGILPVLCFWRESCMLGWKYCLLQHADCGGARGRRLLREGTIVAVRFPPKHYGWNPRTFRTGGGGATVSCPSWRHRLGGLGSSMFGVSLSTSSDAMLLIFRLLGGV